MALRTAVFSIHSYERSDFLKLNERFNHDIHYFEARLCLETVQLAKGFQVVSLFAHDDANREVIEKLAAYGVQLLALRSAGFNHVDLEAARHYGMKIVRVPAYSPYSVAEFTIAMILTLNRKIHRAQARVRELNFSLDGLMGFDLNRKTVGVIGVGRIGTALCHILNGFGCEVLGFDTKPNSSLPFVRYTTLDDIYRRSDIISLHIPLSQATHHLINESAIRQMKPGVFLINTGRGGLIDTKALIQGLKTQHIGAAGLDVYEEEESIYSRDLSGSVLQDDILARLMTFPNVLLTAHQAFLTQEAVHNIVETTLQNVWQFEHNEILENQVEVT